MMTTFPIAAQEYSRAGDEVCTCRVYLQYNEGHFRWRRLFNEFMKHDESFKLIIQCKTIWVSNPPVIISNAKEAVNRWNMSHPDSDIELCFIRSGSVIWIEKRQKVADLLTLLEEEDE